MQSDGNMGLSYRCRYSVCLWTPSITSAGLVRTHSTHCRCRTGSNQPLEHLSEAPPLALSQKPSFRPPGKILKWIPRYTLCRLAAKIRMAAMLFPHQLGYGVKGGAERRSQFILQGSVYRILSNSVFLSLTAITHLTHYIGTRCHTLCMLIYTPPRISFCPHHLTLPPPSSIGATKSFSLWRECNKEILSCLFSSSASQFTLLGYKWS